MTTQVRTARVRTPRFVRPRAAPSYGGGVPVSVKTYTADTSSRVETVNLQVPAGATTAQVRLRSTGGNNWYWTIDGVGITA